jgi:Swt1-like HEPN
LSKSRDDLRQWMFRTLMFEAEAEQFRIAGIRVGADHREAERSLLEGQLAPFSVSLRNDALTMARIYSLLFAFENSVRDLIKERLQDKHASDWWIKAIPQKIQKFAEDRQQKAQAESWLEGHKTALLGFVDFGHLADIIVANWDEFDDLVPSQHWLKQRMEELEHARNFIAHHRLLLPSEFARIEMYIGDWNRMVGL